MSFEIIHYVKKKWIKHGMYCVNCTVLNLHYNSLGKKYLCNWDYNLLLRCEGNSCSTAASALPQAETDVSQSKNGAGSVVTLRSKPWRKPGLCTRHETCLFLYFWNAQFRYSRKEIKNLKTKGYCDRSRGHSWLLGMKTQCMRTKSSTAGSDTREEAESVARNEQIFNL